MDTMNPTPLIPHYKGEDTPNSCALSFYLYHRYMIEMLRQHNPTEVTRQTAFQYGKIYMTPWANDPDGVDTFYQQHRNELIAFQEQMVHNRVKELMGSLNGLYTGMFRKVPMDINTVRAIKAECEYLKDNQANMPKTLFDLAKMNSNNLSYGRRNKSAAAPLEVIDTILRGNFNTFMDTNKDNDNAHAKHHLGAERFEILDPKFYECFCRDIPEATNFVLSHDLMAGILLCSIAFHLFLPNHMHPMTLDRMYQKFIQRDTNYLKAVAECRPYSTMTANEVLNSDDRLFCWKIMKSDAQYRGSAETYSTPDSLSERYLVCQYLNSTNTFYNSSVK